MEESPRSTKRRKLDTSKRIVSSPSMVGSATRASGRLANRSISYAAGRPAKHTALTDIDIYDDIEGALSVEPSPRPEPRPAFSNGDTAGTTNEHQTAAATPKRRRGRPSKAGSASRSAFKTITKGYAHEEDTETDIRDELGQAASTPRKGARAARIPTVSARKGVTPAPSELRQAKNPTLDQEQSLTPLVKAVSVKSRMGTKAVPRLRNTVATADIEENAIPPLLRSTRKKPPVIERTSVPETEDEHDQDASPGSRQQPASTRQSNYTDHLRSTEATTLPIELTRSDDVEMDGNSVLESVLDPTEPSPFNKPASALKEKAIPSLVCGNLSHGPEVDLLKTIVLERISAKRPTALVGVDAEYQSVRQLVEQTVIAGEGNSMLVIGARGSGKTVLVNKVLSEMTKDNGGEFHVVRLNGFIHTDDKIALREIWRQLGKEMDTEDDGSGPGKNYADTLTTLLALLSHPSEHTGEITDQVAKAVIFVIDEFELFAQHPRQTLLYNLFDIAQSRKAPIAVLGLTTRIDVMNTLEKRVKSRFSHRYVHLSLAKSFTVFQEVCKACVMVEPKQLSVLDRGILEGGVHATAADITAKKASKAEGVNVLEEWNAIIQKTFASPTFLTNHLAPHFYRTKSVQAVLNSFSLPASTLCTRQAFAAVNTLSAPDSKIHLVPHLSTLSLSLLIAAARLDIIHDADTCNFNMAYDEYVTLASRARIQSAAGGISASGSVSKVWSRDVAKREWECLVRVGLIMPVIQGQAGGFSMVRCDVALEEISAILAEEKGLDRQLERWCKAI
ncbi:origin recognition complex subunit 4 C-terminus-domain-containing protein [Paraphoma chrysanthemicola]|uniref:Origin recognition complex subunit 4 n=1 Tax=Paraphoma chrysanthemicola TaxID=798071 RepID=A0A8K0QUL9_9PLEO|nr:origin recognition complex subunit 4 C-terminus-domain-containing protein [Paraphoma chrysanthemicola]